MVKLNGLRKRVRQIKEGAEKGHEKAMMMAEANAKRLAAVDTGEMRGEIEVVKGEDESEIYLVAKANHSGPVEYGDENRKPQQFIRPTAAMLRVEAPDIIAKEIKKRL